MSRRRRQTGGGRRRGARALLWLVVLLALLAGVIFLLRPLRLPQPVRLLWERVFPQRAPRGELEGPYDVAYVYDGDTVCVRIGNEEQTVRMIGVDAPESVHRDESKNTPEGALASQWLRELLEGRSVWLEYDEQREDRYGRLLAYVWLPDAESMAEDELLRSGMAQILPLEPNERYSLRFAALEQEARVNGAGFWGTGFFK